MNNLCAHNINLEKSRFSSALSRCPSRHYSSGSFFFFLYDVWDRSTFIRYFHQTSDSFKIQLLSTLSSFVQMSALLREPVRTTSKLSRSVSEGITVDREVGKGEGQVRRETLSYSWIRLIGFCAYTGPSRFLGPYRLGNQLQFVENRTGNKGHKFFIRREPHSSRSSHDSSVRASPPTLLSADIPHGVPEKARDLYGGFRDIPSRFIACQISRRERAVCTF